MHNVNIHEEFQKLFDIYKSKYGNQKAFKSMRHNKKTGDATPVFYVGVPGIAVALTITASMASTVGLLYMPFKWYIWVPYVILVFFIFRFAMKYDKVRQIRFMAFSLLEMSMNLMEKANAEEEHEHKKTGYEKAKDLLHRTSEWVDEPAIAQQIAELERVLL